MGHLTETLLLFVLFAASSAFVLNSNATSDPALNASVAEQMDEPQKREAAVQPQGESCPYGWSRIGSRCFQYISLPADWATAEGHCLNLRANLVSVHSETEYQALKTLIRTYDNHENPTWLGLSNCEKMDNWFWSDGTKFHYRKWNTNEPSHSNGECCVHMNAGAQKNWNDIYCNLAYPFVCTKRVE